MRSKILDIICFVIGPVLLPFGLLDFSYRHSGDGPFREPSTYAVYYYGQDAILMVTLGVGLIAYGLLRRNWSKGS